MLTLDELFKKTAAKPCIYWLPLTGACWAGLGLRWACHGSVLYPCRHGSCALPALVVSGADEQVAEKKRKAAEAAAAKAAPANGAQAS